jgi:hypothetical protein
MGMGVKTTMIAPATAIVAPTAMVAAVIVTVITTAVIWVSEAEGDDRRVIRRPVGWTI